MSSRDYIYQNSASYQKKLKERSVPNALIHPNANVNLNSNQNVNLKPNLKKWQNPDYKRIFEEKERLRLLEIERQKADEKKRKEEREKRRREKEREVATTHVEEEKKAVRENTLVRYEPNQNRALDPVQQRMVYIQYLLNTFELHPDFDIHYYRNNNPDICHLNNYELVYHWNHVGVNEKETRIYNRSGFESRYPNYYQENPIYIFLHICSLHNGVQIMNEQIEAIVESGLYEKCKNILICVVGPAIQIPNQKYSKILLLYHDPNPKYYEVKTINYIQYLSNRISDKSLILYIHTKGVRKNGDQACVRSWRKLLEYWTIGKHDLAIQYLRNYDTYGSNVINMCPSEQNQYLYYVNPKHCFHYSGNFWWATAQHIRQLPQLEHDAYSSHAVSTRCRAENWILSRLPAMKGFEIFYQKNYVHPYHTFCEPEKYQKKYIEIFAGRNNFSILKSESSPES